MFHDSMDLSRLMVHVQQVEDNKNNRRVGEVRSPNPSYKAGSSRGGGRSTFGIHDQPRLKKGIRVHGTLTLRGVQHIKEAAPCQRREWR